MQRRPNEVGIVSSSGTVPEAQICSPAFVTDKQGGEPGMVYQQESREI